MPVFLHTHEGTKLPLDLAATPDQSLAQAIWLSGLVSPPPLCSGLGFCCRCKVRLHPAPPPLPEEQKWLGQDCAAGWRLACRHTAHSLPDGTDIFLPPAPVPQRRLGMLPGPHKPLLLAVDLGTTSLHWRALTNAGHIFAEGQEINPQMGAGSDVMSRLAAASRPGGLRQLSNLVQQSLRAIVQALPPVAALCVAGNTAMTAILLQKDVSALAAAPYQCPLPGHSVEHLPDLPPLYVPPQIAPFVGGDISAGYSALPQEAHENYPFLLADLGTNGEFVLATSPHKAFVASVPLGPSLEGIGLRFGDMADATFGKGIVHSVTLGQQGLVPATLAHDRPQRLCGTGYLSLIHALLRAGIVSEQGSFQSQPAMPLFRTLAAQLCQQEGESILPLPQWGHMYLAAADVEEILKVKAAFSLALQTLLRTAEIPPTALRRIWLAGAMGAHVNAADLEALGFVPQGMAARITAVGNSSLEGAQHLLLHPESRPDLAVWSQKCLIVPMAQESSFLTNFMRHMRFSYPE